jgi:uncharacterized protein YuzB (UPF0349 family)
MLSNDDIDAMDYNALMTHASTLRGLVERSYADTVGMDHAESESYVESTVGGVKRVLRRIDQRLLKIAQPKTVKTTSYDTSVHCPKCFRAVSALVAVDELWLFGATEAQKIVNLYCRQCKGIRWRK